MMNMSKTFITAVKALKRNKMRSALTSIGIVIGVSSVIVMVGLGNSAQVAVRDKMYTFGTNAMRVRSKVKLLSRFDVEYMKKNFYSVNYITPVLQNSRMVVKYRDRHMKPVRVFGTNEDYLKLKSRTIEMGRFFTNEEVRSLTKVAVIGYKNWKELFNFKNPIGEQIHVGNIIVKVIGVLKEEGQSFSGTEFDNTVVMPYTVANARIWGRTLGFESLYVSSKEEEHIDSLSGQITRYLRHKHRLRHDEKDDFKIYSSKDKLKVADDISNALSILLAGIASISLFVGGVGIMNIMLVSVTERTREIGIRIAIGAKQKDIMYQFLIESVTLTSGGGIIGISLGLVVYYIIAYFVQWPFIFSFFSVFISFIFSAAVGIFFGYYPSKKASSLKPIDALKFE